ncbi:MAG TPA: helix-hairpin-helix domain-containing protein [Polyangiaceae bacterium]|nr:helix-hairpin-helix domain-containing protein [Polyangiaceae bacterium]
MALVEPQHALLQRTPGSHGSPPPAGAPEPSAPPSSTSIAPAAPANTAQSGARMGPWAKLIAKTCASLALLAGLAGIGAFVTWQQPQLRGMRIDARPSASGAWLAASKPDKSNPGSEFTAQAAANPLAHESGPQVRAVVTSPASRLEPTVSPASSSAGSDTTALPGLTADGKVILNLAGASELRRLPGVGAKRAEAILALRNKLGRFKSPNDLLRVRGVGLRMLRRWLPLIVLDAPEPSTAGGSAQLR